MGNLTEKDISKVISVLKSFDLNLGEKLESHDWHIDNAMPEFPGTVGCRCQKCGDTINIYKPETYEKDDIYNFPGQLSCRNKIIKDVIT